MTFEDEGSVAVDGENSYQEPTEDQETQEESSEQVENDSSENSSSQTESEEGSQPEKTEKGTRLANDPLQQANQLRANAEREVREYRQFLNDPLAVKQYLAELEKERGGTETVEQDQEGTIDPDKIETVDDLKAYAKQLKREQEQVLKEVRGQVNGFTERQQEVAKVNKISSGIASVQQKYSALREFNADGTPNPEFDPELEAEFGQLYEELDYDAQRGTFHGKVDIERLADRFMKAAKRGESQGSKRAQTIVKDKRNGRVISGSGSQSSGTDESNMSAAQVIASRINRAKGRGR